MRQWKRYSTRQQSEHRLRRRGRGSKIRQRSRRFRIKYRSRGSKTRHRSRRSKTKRRNKGSKIRRKSRGSKTRQRIGDSGLENKSVGDLRPDAGARYLRQDNKRVVKQATQAHIEVQSRFFFLALRFFFFLIFLSLEFVISSTGKIIMFGLSMTSTNRGALFSR